jgi:hypothetical protein
MAVMAKSDPTKDPEFQKVVQHFLTTSPKPHKPTGRPKSATKRKHAVKTATTAREK